MIPSVGITYQSITVQGAVGGWCLLSEVQRVIGCSVVSFNSITALVLPLDKLLCQVDIASGEMPGTWLYRVKQQSKSISGYTIVMHQEIF